MYEAQINEYIDQGYAKKRKKRKKFQKIKPLQHGKSLSICLIPTYLTAYYEQTKSNRS